MISAREEKIGLGKERTAMQSHQRLQLAPGRAQELDGSSELFQIKAQGLGFFTHTLARRKILSAPEREPDLHTHVCIYMQYAYSDPFVDLYSLALSLRGPRHRGGNEHT